MKYTLRKPYSLHGIRYRNVDADPEGWGFPHTVLQLEYLGKRQWRLFRPERSALWVRDQKVLPRRPRQNIATGTLAQLRPAIEQALQQIAEEWENLKRQHRS